MKHRSLNNVKLGGFVLGGLAFLVIILYMIGKNKNMFGDTYPLKGRFENVQGLVPGNNVRYSGIQSGTVKKITILNDTTIEVTMNIDRRMKSIIRKNAIVSIGTDGLVGNKVVNIAPSKEPSVLALPGDVLASRKAIDTDEMLHTLFKTNNDVAVIAEGLKITIDRLNNSNAMWTLLNDNALPAGIRASVSNIKQATSKAKDIANELDALVVSLQKGEGTLGILLKDTSIASQLNGALLTIRNVGVKADSLTMEVSGLLSYIKEDMQTGQGTIPRLLNDSLLAKKIEASLDNIQKGTDDFHQNMEALKHNFLFRNYFRKLEKKKKTNEY